MPCHHRRVTSPDHSFQLRSLTIGDEPEAWRAAGFTVVDGVTVVGSTVILLDPSADPGITAHLAGLENPVDGLRIAANDASAPSLALHANHVTAFDHLVAMSPAIQRTSDALVDAGLDLRRTRTFTVDGATRRQDFFWMGDVILELVGVEGESGQGPASWWGLALECDDLDAAADALGDSIGAPKDAVQKGRRIATVRTRDLGISVPIALMSPHIAD